MNTGLLIFMVHDASVEPLLQRLGLAVDGGLMFRPPTTEA